MKDTKEEEAYSGTKAILSRQETVPILSRLTPDRLWMLMSKPTYSEVPTQGEDFA